MPTTDELHQVARARNQWVGHIILILFQFYKVLLPQYALPSSPWLILSRPLFLLSPFKKGEGTVFDLELRFSQWQQKLLRMWLLFGILECFWTILDIGREESCCQKVNPNPRQEKWWETRFHTISLDFRTVKYHCSSVYHCLGAYVQISQVLLFFQSNFDIIVYVFKYFIKLPPSKYVRKQYFLLQENYHILVDF